MVTTTVHLHEASAFAQAASIDHEAEVGGKGTDRNVKQHGDEHQDQVGRPDIDEPEPVVAAALDQHVDGWGLERPTMRLRVGGGLDKHARAADALEQALVFVHCLLPMEQGVSCG